MDLTAAADELYSVRPDEFVGRRTELAAEARQAGDKDLVAGIKRLPKPTTAAWVVNQLVRHESEQVEQVLELGAALRQAQESMAGEELRQLGKQRRQLTSAVTRQARALAAELGHKVAEPVADQIENTLHAAMVDADASKAVRTGCLVKPLAVTGTDAGDVAEAVALPEAIGATDVRRPSARAKPRPGPERPEKGEEAEEAQRPDLSVVEDSSRRIEEAEGEVKAAEAELADAERRLDKAERKVAKREAKGLQLQAELDELRRRIAVVEQRVEANEDDLTAAEETRDEREEAMAQARQAVEKARGALDALR